MSTLPDNHAPGYLRGTGMAGESTSPVGGWELSDTKIQGMWAPRMSDRRYAVAWVIRDEEGRILSDATEVVAFGGEFFADESVADAGLKARRPLRTTVEKIDFITGTLGLPTKQLSAAMGVERQTIYNWRGGQQPRRAHRERLDELCEVAQDWASLCSHDLSASLHEKGPDGPSLMDLLAAQPLDRAAISRAIRAWAETINARKDHLRSNARTMRDKFAKRGVDKLSREQTEGNYHHLSLRSTEK